jgi:hypothetical protein
MTTKTAKHGKDQPLAKSRIDSKAEIIEPIDYSFKELLSIKGIEILR